ncbi:hypothetical protein [Andreprevotia chitinilytica]|uniref:hypothetical protein n=1 Tax=Andreprevotia chitinilytica TaxID=396808 RepID=UPI0005505282|nr:hypothetical protein [Andreprevotia chitinilytica]
MRRLFALLALLISFNALAEPATPAAPFTPTADRRTEDQTFLTFPEWFLVHSPAEYAAYVGKDRPISDFPFWGHIGQLWGSYAKVTEATKPYAFNFGYHVMIMVIASSTTVEYGLRSAYETLIGRLSELTRSDEPTAEDRYAAHIAQDYVDFIRRLPWYQYDFVAALKGVWQDTGYGGPNLIRKWERKYALTTEYGIKAVYGYLIKLATGAAYDVAALNTIVVLDHAPVRPPADLPDYKPLKALPNNEQLASLPRYEAFKVYSAALAKQGVNFAEIAGNGPNAKLLITVLSPRSWETLPAGNSVLFVQPVLTDPARKRVALVTTVAGLGDTLRSLAKGGIEVEHVYDY